MQRTIDETERRRAKQIAYNEENNILPRTLAKSKEEIMSQRSILDFRAVPKAYIEPEDRGLMAADPVVEYLGRDQIEKLIDGQKVPGFNLIWSIRFSKYIYPMLTD